MTATPALNVNQFSIVPVLGQLDLETQGTVVTGAVSNSQGAAIVAGQPVKVENSLGGVPKVLSLVAGDTPNAFAVRNLKDANFPANSRLELALDNSVMWMTSNAAINRWAPVEVDLSTPGNVGPAGGVNPVIGLAFDEANGTGQLIRVLILLPKPGASAAGALRTAIVSATLAEINAGKVLIPASVGKKITVVNYAARVTGAFATGTAVILESTNVAPVLVTTLAEAGLTNGAVLIPSSGNTTLGAGFAAQLGSGDGLQVVNSGAAQTAGTSIQFTLSYLQG